MAEAEETTEALEDEAFGKWLAELQDSDAEEEPEEEEEEVPAVERLEKKVDTLVKEKQTKEIIDKFMAGASEDARRLFGIYQRGDEDPKQLKAIMELAVVKAREAEPPPDVIEKKAAQMAKEDYGVGPISGGSKTVEDDGWEKAREAVRRGDMHAAFKMWESLPPTGGVTTEE